MMPIGTYRFNREKATRALIETGVMNKTGIVWIAIPLRPTLIMITQ
jgi:hypothetical protein